MAQFPANTPFFTTKVDLVDDILAAHVNMLQQEVIAISQVIGTGVGANDPTTAAGGYPNGTLHARLQHLETGKENAGVAAGILAGAFSLGGAAGNRIDYDGETSIQGRRNSDGAPINLHLNWWGGGNVYANELISTNLYSQQKVFGQALELSSGAPYIDFHYSSDPGDFSLRLIATGYDTLYLDGGSLWVSQYGAEVHVANGRVVGDYDNQGGWDTAAIRSGGVGGSGNAMYSLWANSTAAIMKWYSGNGYIEFRNSDDSGYVNIKAANISPSSRRFKEDITPTERGLEEILLLEPVSFFLKSSRLLDTDGEEIEPSEGWAKTHTTKNLGLIAEDVEDVIPEVVGYDDEGQVDSLDYVGLIPVLINAVKTLSSQVEELRAEIATLKG